MAAFSTFAIAALGLSALNLGASVYAGEQQAKSQRKGLRQQNMAQQEAENRALRQDREGQIAENRANRRAPDLNVLLSQQLPKPGATGIDSERLLLGRQGLLGI